MNTVYRDLWITTWIESAYYIEAISFFLQCIILFVFRTCRSCNTKSMLHCMRWTIYASDCPVYDNDEQETCHIPNTYQYSQLFCVCDTIALCLHSKCALDALKYHRKKKQEDKNIRKSQLTSWNEYDVFLIAFLFILINWI